MHEEMTKFREKIQEKQKEMSDTPYGRSTEILFKEFLIDLDVLMDELQTHLIKLDLVIGIPIK